VTVNAITPGFIATEMTDVLSDKVKEELQKQIPMERFGAPEDIANAVYFLASDLGSYITGHVLSVNGGMYM
jgi:3-oxoacyl-[acyl-carrier protein] reductase